MADVLGGAVRWRVGRRYPGIAAAISLGLVCGAAGAAMAASGEQIPPPVSLSLQNTTDGWQEAAGGIRRGGVLMNKLQLVAAFDGTSVGLPAWDARLQYFRTDGPSLSGELVGDVQTASNIDAVSTNRLMEAWVRRIFRGGGVKIGLIDLNAEFDSIDPAGLFINSSHGIGPDLSKSGIAGPSIFPVSALGIDATWSPDSTWTLHAAVFDGVPGDPAHPKAFATAVFDRQAGAMLIGQADWKLSKDVQASFGVWGYTSSFPRPDEPGARQTGETGVYAFIEGPLPVGDGWKGWLRVGGADPRVALIADYVGLGLVKEGPLPGRPQDSLGVAVARAGLGDPARPQADLPAAETTFELTYRFQANAHVAIQPDAQYILHPALRPHLGDALLLGLRLSLSFKTGD
jgi:porin